MAWTSARRWGLLGAFGLLTALPAPAGAAEPCKLLTVQEVGQAFGAAAPAVRPIGRMGCYWSAGGTWASVVLLPASNWAGEIAPAPGMIKTSVGALGEAASFSELVRPAAIAGCRLALHDLAAGRRCPQERGLTLCVKHGSYVIVVVVAGLMDEGRERSEEAALARLVLRRL